MSEMTPEKAQALLDYTEHSRHEPFKSVMPMDMKEANALARAYIAQAAELTRLRAKVEAADKLAEALKFYADLSHEGPWHLPSEDYGKRARSALAAYEGVKG